MGVKVALAEDPLLPGDFGLYSRTSTIHEGPSLMADFIDWTLVKVSSWLACVTGDERYLRILSSTLFFFAMDTPVEVWSSWWSYRKNE